ncbi:MAG: hypothetical protein ACT4O2_07615 [Beijerinckiaceae bacterium]
MFTGKTTTLTFVSHRVSTSANMVDVMIGDYCGRHSVTIPEQGALFGDGS